MGQGRRRRPSRGLSEKQERFVRLIARGVSNAEACRRVGINRRTGTRWRFRRTILNTAGEAVQYPPVRVPTRPKPRHPRYLSLAERTMMCDLRREKKTLREIAQAIGRSPSTVSRELRRNADQFGRYRPHTAERLAAERLPRPRTRRLLVDAELRATVTQLLGKRWSPEPAAGASASVRDRDTIGVGQARRADARPRRLWWRRLLTLLIKLPWWHAGNNSPFSWSVRASGMNHTATPGSPAGRSSLLS